MEICESVRENKRVREICESVRENRRVREICESVRENRRERERNFRQRLPSHKLRWKTRVNMYVCRQQHAAFDDYYDHLGY